MKTSFLLLAAGLSRRMKADKALLDYHGEPWIRRQVREVRKSQVVDRIVIVDQPAKKDLYQNCLSEFSNIHFVENPVPNSAPVDSIFLAFQQQNFPGGVFLSPIDVPLKGKIISDLHGQRSPGAWVIKPRFQGRGGHPVWLSAEAVSNFLANPQRMDFWIRSLPSGSVRNVDISEEWIQLNLNTPQDWQQFLDQEKDHPEDSPE